jgi:hypothetical protein
MTPDPSITERVVENAFRPLECTIPADLTIAEWRRRRRSESPNGACEHLHDTTTRYDHARKLLTFLLVCSVCCTEKVIETLHYEPRFERSQPIPSQ